MTTFDPMHRSCAEHAYARFVRPQPLLAILRGDSCMGRAPRLKERDMQCSVVQQIDVRKCSMPTEVACGLFKMPAKVEYGGGVK